LPLSCSRYLEFNSWVWQVNGLNLLVDPVFGTLDFGVPALVRAKKRVSGSKMARYYCLELVDLMRVVRVTSEVPRQM